MATEETHADPGFQTPSGVPTERVYRHRECGGLTQVGGHDFLRLANPFAAVSATICCGCGKAVPIRQVEWIDTGENVASYRKRLRLSTPLGRRLFFGSLGIASGAVIGFACGFVGGLLMIGPVGNRPWWLQESGLIGGAVAAIAGASLGAQLLPAHLMRFVWGLDYRGEP